MSRTYDGPVVFGSDGVHYPVGKDGTPDTKRPLRADGDGWRIAETDEPLHNDAHHLAELNLEVGGE